MRTAHIKTFGCKVNQHESTLLEDTLLAAGYGLVPEHDPADLVVINSCTVTHRGDADARKAIRQALRRNPATYVVLTGCYAQVAPDDAAKQAGIDLILGNREKYDLASYLPHELFKDEAPRVLVGDIATVTPLTLPGAPTAGARARAFLKVQEGCHLRCAFCIVPVARGVERSVAPEEVARAIREYAAQGYPEVVLTGVHLGAYGRDHDASLAALITQLDALDVANIRVLSLEPMEVDATFLAAIQASSRVCPHFHLPLQSGSDAILRRMGRPYTRAQFDAICASLKQWNPDTCIGTDLIVGFPGETDEDFADTASYLAEGPIDYAHLFPYSIREGTRAARMVDQIPAPVKAERMRVLQAIDARNRLAFAQRQDGSIRACVLEWPIDEPGEWVSAVADNYALARVRSADLPHRPRVATRHLHWNGHFLEGRACSTS